MPAGFWQRAAAWTLDAAPLAWPAWWIGAGTWPPAPAHWQRFAAALSAAFERPLRWLLDGDTPLQAAARLLVDPALPDVARTLGEALARSLAGPLAAFALLAFAWHVGFERSCWQGTPGKRALGLRVADAAGAPPAAWRSAWRFLAGSASWLTLNLGHALAAVPPGRAALHDRLSRTRVLARDAALPGWARAWLLLLALLLLAANAWLLMALDAVAQQALQRVLGAY